MNSSLIDRLLPIYHSAPKKRHDLLCSDLSNNSSLSNVSAETIDVCVQEIEALISNSVSYAKDELYGQITRQEAIQRIKALSPEISNESLEIILERANYYARR
ncbi:hypothetical protein OA92_20150 [Marinomonas sp. SBI22]|nr:hypothetical protein OA92_20150 [Marinomonas sp. SBI22]KZM41832.1 hypothetical protein OA91_15180 [Marinomonas sp. SBI8L]